MEQLEVELVVQNIAHWLFSEQCIGSLTLVCKKWYCFLKKMHLEQYHQFRHGRNRVLQSIDKGFVHFRIYKPILSKSNAESIQYALVNKIKCTDPENPNKSMDFHQPKFLIKCSEINIDLKHETSLEQHCDYILTRPTFLTPLSNHLSKSLKVKEIEKTGPIIEEIKDDYPPRLIIETRDSFNEIKRRSLSPPPPPRRKTNSKNLIRKYVKRYKTASRSQLIIN